MTAVEFIVEQVLAYKSPTNVNGTDYILIPVDKIDFLKEQSKEMEKEQKQRFNKFLNDEMELGISDKKTIERIQWYYNNYLLTFKSE